MQLFPTTPTAEPNTDRLTIRALQLLADRDFGPEWQGILASEHGYSIRARLTELARSNKRIRRLVSRGYPAPTPTIEAMEIYVPERLEF